MDGCGASYPRTYTETTGETTPETVGETTKGTSGRTEVARSGAELRFSYIRHVKASEPPQHPFTEEYEAFRGDERPIPAAPPYPRSQPCEEAEHCTDENQS